MPRYRDRALRALGDDGFDQKHPLFHGSDAPEPIASFRPTSVSANSDAFLGAWEVERTGVFLTDDPRFARQFGAHVGAYAVRVGKIADLDVGWAVGTNPVRWAFVEGLDATGTDRDLWLTATSVRHPWQMFDNDLGYRFVAWLESEGYDAARYTESVDAGDEEITAQTTVVFDPSNVRPLPAVSITEPHKCRSMAP